MQPFVGRKEELQKLKDTFALNRACLVVIKGRRRIGKSRLVQEFGKRHHVVSFTGLPPIEGITAQDQRDNFAHQLAINCGGKQQAFTDWIDAFYELSNHLKNKPTIILFDEISWMGSEDPTFVPKLKVWWDSVLQNYSQVMLIFCGSVSLWIEKNIINSTAFFGRITLQIDLEQLSLGESAQFLRAIGFKGSSYDVFKILSVTGGVPWYLEQISPEHMADENIKRLCFEKNGLLTTEFDKIFHDLFNKHGSTYKEIAHILADGMKDLAQIRQLLEYAQSGSLSAMMDALIVAGFVTKHYSWSLKTEQLGKQSLYRLSDNYLRFYIKYIEPNMAKIGTRSFHNAAVQHLLAWDTIMGFQVENLLLNNRPLLIKALGIDPADIVADNPYMQRKTQRQKGCQIDYLLQTVTKNLFVCEFKFRRRELGMEVIDSVADKVKRFSVPRGYAVVPVLFHMGGVADAVSIKKYFYRIIDIVDFIEEK